MRILIVTIIFLIAIANSMAQEPIQPAPLDIGSLQINSQINQIGSKVDETKASCVAILEENKQLNEQISTNINLELKKARILSFLSVFSATLLAFMIYGFVEYIVERKKRLIYEKEAKVKYGI